MTAKLEELDALVKAATPGPWHVFGSGDLAVVGQALTHGNSDVCLMEDVAQTDANAALIVWLVNNAPAMLRAQAEEIARLSRALEPFASDSVWLFRDRITDDDLRNARAALGSPPDA